MAKRNFVITAVVFFTMFALFQTVNADEKWDKVVAAAKKEGSVVVNGPSFRSLSRALNEGFNKAYGINVEYLGLGSKIIPTAEREAAAGKVTVDIYIGGLRSIMVFLDKDLVEPIDGMLLEEVKDPSKWKGGALKWVDNTKRYGLQTSEYVMTDLFVNTDHVDPAKIQSWKDLLKPEYKGKIGSFDPRRGGAGQAIARYLLQIFDEELVVKLYKGQNVAFVRDHRQVAEWAARGTYPIVLGAVQSMIEKFRKEGFPLVRVFPKDGPGSLLGGFSTIAMFKGAPHSNAARVFLNWFASKEGQQAYSAAVLEPSRRLDVPTSGLPDYVKPNPKIKYEVDQYTEEWQRKISPALEKRLRKALGT